MKKIVTKTYHNKHLRQLFKFGIVGVIAAMVNLLGVFLLVEIFNMKPLIANIFAFMISFNVSYLGQRFWSFAETTVRHRKAIPKYFTVAIVGFCLNELLFSIFLHILHLYYMLALVIVIGLVAVFSFICNKLWVFR
jgi:putative flippase GtrA